MPPESRRELTEEERAHMGGVMDDRFGTSHVAVDRETEFEAGYWAARAFYAERVVPVSSEQEREEITRLRGSIRDAIAALHGVGILSGPQAEREKSVNILSDALSIAAAAPARSVVEASGDCICQRAAEGHLGWDKSMVSPDCPVHGHEAVERPPDPSIEAVKEFFAVEASGEREAAWRRFLEDNDPEPTMAWVHLAFDTAWNARGLAASTRVPDEAAEAEASDRVYSADEVEAIIEASHGHGVKAGEERAAGTLDENEVDAMPLLIQTAVGEAEELLGRPVGAASRVPSARPSGCTPCSDCGADYAAVTGAWLASNEFWERIVGSDQSIVLCPLCFIRRCDRALYRGAPSSSAPEQDTELPIAEARGEDWGQEMPHPPSERCEGEAAPSQPQDDRPLGHGHSAPEQVERGPRLDRISYLAGYIAACGDCKSAVAPDNNLAVGLFAERFWKATGADRDAVLDAVSGPPERHVAFADLRGQLEAAGMADGEIDEAEYQATRARVIDGTGTRFERQEFIDFIEGAIPSGPPESDERQVMERAWRRFLTENDPEPDMAWVQLAFEASWRAHAAVAWVGPQSAERYASAVEAATKAAWEHGPVEDASWELVTPAQRELLAAEWAAGLDAYREER